MQNETALPRLQALLPEQGVALALLETGPAEGLGMAQLIDLLQTDAVLCERLAGYASCTADAATPADGSKPQGSPTLSQTASRLGAASVRQLTLGLALLEQQASGPCPGFDYGGYWSRALLMGTALRQLGTSLRLGEGDALFCTGLLARVGSLALARAHPVPYGKIMATGAVGERLRKLEQKFLRTDHIQLSMHLLGQAGVADEWVQALHCEDEPVQPATVVPSRSWQLGQALELAHQMAELATLAPEEQAARTAALVDLANRLGLDATEFGRCMDAAVATWHALGATLPVATRSMAGFDALVAENVRPDRQVNASWLRVMIVDDDPIALHVVQEWLGNGCGYSVKVAVNGAEALALAEGFLPHVVLTDWRMPVMDGLALCTALRSSDWGKSMYVIMLTSAELESDLVEAFNAGVDDYLNKPINLVALSARLKAAWRYVRLRDAWEQDNTRLSRLASELALSNRRLQHSALTDSLTELANRRAGLVALTQAWAMVARYSQPLTVITNDIDHFKAVNDVYGHAAGDAVLQQFARCLRTAARSEDTVCRWGGEEFLIILPNIDLQGGQLAAERLRKVVEASHVSFEGRDLHVTASFGVASWEPGLLSIEQLLALGDQALYAAKAGGRNCVCAVQQAGA